MTLQAIDPRDPQDPRNPQDHLYELSSWKEIAAYLGVTIRTAQRWEIEKALPVKRTAGGRVAATTSALDRWKQGGEELPKWWDNTTRLLVLCVVEGALLVAALAALWWVWAHSA
jgi:hypothetical protein